MRLLIIIDSLGSGGAETSTEVICDYLKQKSEYFEILCFDKKKVGVQDRMISKGYSITFIKKGNIFSEIFQIREHIKKGKFDLVHSVLFRANLRTRLAKLTIRFYHLESLVNTTYSQERFNDVKVNQAVLKVYFLIDKITSKFLVNHFHSITQTVKEHYCEKLGVNPEKITVIFRGRKPLNKQKEYPLFSGNQPLKLINVGRHEFQKGQIYLLKVINELKRRGYSIELIILGRNGSETKLLNTYIGFARFCCIIVDLCGS
jgi:glycosyltransferase involved in cell wall biosynthesis